MNKQIVIATFLGTISTQDAAPAVVCEDAFTKVADAEKLALDGKKATLATEKTTLAGLAASELAAYNTAKTRSDAQTTLMAPFILARDTAKKAHDDKVKASTTAAGKITALDIEIGVENNKLTAANVLVSAQEAKINAQKIIQAKLDAAVTEHKTEVALMQTELNTATTAATAAATALTTATQAKNDFITARAKATGTPLGTGKLLIDATAAAGTKATAFNTATTEESTAFGTYKTAKLAFDKDTRMKADYLAACTHGSFDCKGWSNSPIRDLYDGASNSLGGVGTGTTGTKTTQTTAWGLKVTALATAQDNKNQADIAKEVAQANDTTSAGTVTTLTAAETTASNAKNTADAAKTTATTNFNTATAQHTQATTDQARGNALITKLNNELKPLNDDVVVAKYLKKIQTDKRAVQEAAKTAADLNLANFKSIMDMAQETVTRAKKRQDFENALTATAAASKKVIDDKVTANATAITKNAADIVAAEKKQKAAVAYCKGVGYDKAQTAMKDLLADTKARTAKAATVKTAYDAKAAFPTGGEAGSDCAFPSEAGKPRPVCKEGFCCGAAQKFMRDGTKLAVETCQKNVGVSTYTYYPPLPAGAQVEPTPETWRFQCISGAKQLVATATAALAATFMMA